MPGRPTVESSTTAPAPTHRASRGRSARSTSGGIAGQRQWTGYDVPDFQATKPPGYKGDLEQGRHGRAGRRRPVHHEARREGLALRAQRAGGWAAADPLRAVGGAGRRTRSTRRIRGIPVARTFNVVGNRYIDPGDPAYPIVVTTYRLTEHHTGGRHEPLAAVARVRSCPSCSWRYRPSWRGNEGSGNAGLGDDRDAPRRHRGQGAGDPADSPVRGDGPDGAPDRHAVALGIPRGSRRAPWPTRSRPLVADPNVTIHEAKAFMCNIVAGRRANELDVAARGRPYAGTARRPARAPGGGGQHRIRHRARAAGRVAG